MALQGALQPPAGSAGNASGAQEEAAAGAPAQGRAERLTLAQTPEGSLALLTDSLLSPIRRIVDGGAIVSLLTGGLLLILFNIGHHLPLGEYITANAVGGGLLLVGGLLSWAGYASNAKERLASLAANKEIRLAAIAATRQLGEQPVNLQPEANPGSPLF